YLPLMMAAMSSWNGQRLYLALDTTILWNRYCLIHLSVICGGRAVPFLWKVIEHKSSTVAFREYKTMLKLSHRLLSKYSDVMLLADRGFANHQLVNWLKNSQWHYCLRLPCDVTIHGARKHPIELKYLHPAKSEAILYHHVRLWLDGECCTNLVLANVKGVKEPWAVITDEEPTLQTLWQSRGAIRQQKAVGLPKAIAMRFRIEELFLDSKSGIFQLEESKIRNCKALERLYLVVALALLFATSQGMAVQLARLRRKVAPHWRRGLSYLKIGLRWLKGVFHKGRSLFSCVPLLAQNSQPCFASLKAKKQYYDAIWFSRIWEVKCSC
ncbi:MAG: transposase, partial [Cyanobacteria bacterium P01_G01_bin.49]